MSNFAADVDAARRLVEQEHARRAGHGAREQDLLLVAAREGAHLLAQVRSPSDARAGPVSAARARSVRRSRNQRRRLSRCKMRQRDVARDVLRRAASPSARRSRGASAIPRAQASAGPLKCEQARRRASPVPRRRLRRAPGSAARDRRRRGRRSRGSRPCAARTRRRCRPSPARPSTASTTGAPRGGRRAAAARDVLAAGHQLDQLRLGRVFRIQRRAGLAVAQNRDPVGDRQHLVEAMRDDRGFRSRAREARR